MLKNATGSVDQQYFVMIILSLALVARALSLFLSEQEDCQKTKALTLKRDIYRLQVFLSDLSSSWV